MRCFFFVFDLEQPIKHTKITCILKIAMYITISS